MKKKSGLLLKICIALVGVIIVGVVVTIIIKNAFYNYEYETEDINEYGVYHDHIVNEEEGMISALLIFPDVISETMQVDAYYYYCGAYVFDNAYELYLECTYTDEEYSLEVQRLSKVSIEYDGKRNNAVYTQTGFRYPAYITIYNDYQTYEYAVIDSENKKIIYVFTQYLGLDKGVIDDNYLPTSYHLDSNLSNTDDGGLNIYYNGEYYFNKAVN